MANWSTLLLSLYLAQTRTQNTLCRAWMTHAPTGCREIHTLHPKRPLIPVIYHDGGSEHPARHAEDLNLHHFTLSLDPVLQPPPSRRAHSPCRRFLRTTVARTSVDPSPAHRAERQLFRRFARRSSWTSPFSTSTRSRTDRPSGIRGPVGYLHRSHNFVPVPLLDISIVAQPTIILYLTAPLILIASTSITTSIPDPETHLPGRFPRRRRLLLFSDVALARRGET